jgi:hypothetical protein
MSSVNVAKCILPHTIKRIIVHEPQFVRNVALLILKINAYHIMQLKIRLLDHFISIISLESKLKVLVACECSERIKKAFMDKGHEAHSCDLKPGELGLPNHHQYDIKDLLKEYKGYFDLMIAHPDCTYMANSGARWLFEKDGRWEQLRQAAEFFNFLKNQDIPRIALENPQPHKWATELIGHYSQKVQPWWFGEGETKGICLWLKNLPPLMAVYIHPDRVPKVHHEPPSPNQKTNRSRTYIGFANAVAEQWGNLPELNSMVK